MPTVLSRETLATMHCTPMEGSRAMSDAEISVQLALLPGWAFVDGALQRTFALRDYHDTIGFVNALAWMIHREDHHPDLHVGYNRCTVRWNTHSVGGVSVNDFVCAAHTDAIFGRDA